MSLGAGSRGGASARWSRRIAVCLGVAVGVCAAAPALADVRPRPRDLRRHTKEEPRERDDAAVSTSAGEVAAAPGPEDPPEMIAPAAA
jgi:hypothetical protein